MSELQSDIERQNSADAVDKSNVVIPAIYARVSQHQHPEHIESLSLDISGILIITMGVFFIAILSWRAWSAR